MYQVIIARPTRLCNADCFYCSAPPIDNIKWTFDTFKEIFDKLLPYMDKDEIAWIWHGGEPLLLEPSFYKKCHEYADALHPSIKWSIQTNLLGYSNKWKDVFKKYFATTTSSSFDFDTTGRTIKGNGVKFRERFLKSLDLLINDGIKPMLIATISEYNKADAIKIYDWNVDKGEDFVHLRYNFCHPSGKLAESNIKLISPISYGKLLVELYNKWIVDVPEFSVTPFDQMIYKMIYGERREYCPWTAKCGGKFLEIEPNGDVYNCSDFADLGDKKYMFGNIFRDEVKTIINSQASREIKKRVVFINKECQSCEHVNECNSGCSHQSVLFAKSLKETKYPYCLSMKLILTRIKESIITGEANDILLRLNINPEEITEDILRVLNSSFDTDFELFGKAISPYGFFDNIANANAIKKRKDVFNELERNK